MNLAELLHLKFPHVQFHTKENTYWSSFRLTPAAHAESAADALEMVKEEALGPKLAQGIVEALKNIPMLLTYEEIVDAVYVDLASIYAGVRPAGAVKNKHTGSVYFLIAKDADLAVGCRFFVASRLDPNNTFGENAYREGTAAFIGCRLRFLRVEGAEKQGMSEREKAKQAHLQMVSSLAKQPVSEAEEVPTQVEEVVPDIAEPPKVKAKTRSKQRQK